MTHAPIIRSLQAFCFRYPLAVPVVTSFGSMVNRPAVFVQVEDEDRQVGWGEAWSNFPSVGAEHRTRIVNEIIAPLVVGQRISSAGVMFSELSACFSTLALQSGEQGPFAQALAAVDIALWDLLAKRAGVPLWRMLGGTSSQMRVYASGINPDGCVATMERMQAQGHRAFKLKIGFDPAGDRANLRDLRHAAGGMMLAADVNQGWTLEQAMQLAPQLDAFDLAWLEEPLRADRPWSEWHRLREVTAPPLAGGENIASVEAFDNALSEGALRVIQPDVAKWGGITACLAVARTALAAGRLYCPHYLGGGIGLLASAHLLAAAGGDGLLEIDSNDNPLRDFFCGPVAQVRDGMIILSDEPGLGIEPDLAAIAQYRTM
jgi:L-alanine-DL-glutamate epimerase-like enolase superfamily enzyme